MNLGHIRHLRGLEDTKSNGDNLSWEESLIFLETFDRENKKSSYNIKQMNLYNSWIT